MSSNDSGYVHVIEDELTARVEDGEVIVVIPVWNGNQISSFGVSVQTSGTLNNSILWDVNDDRVVNVGPESRRVVEVNVGDVGISEPSDVFVCARADVENGGGGGL